MSPVVPLMASEAAEAARFGPKAANLARLGRAGLPIASGFAVDAEAYRVQLCALGLEERAREVFGSEEPERARHAALAVRLALIERPVAPELAGALLEAWRMLSARGARLVVRSSALVEDRAGASFAGQFESFLGLETEEEFLIAVRSCWASLWTTRALRYMATHGVDPAATAMALIVQPLVAARAAGGALSRTADGEILINAAPGLGAALAQGEVVPERHRLDSELRLKETSAGLKYRNLGCVHGGRAPRRAIFAPRCLSPAQAVALGRLVRAAEEAIGLPVEVEWAMDEEGFKLLQARPLALEPAPVPDAVWLERPRLTGHPAGVGWSTGRACVVQCECELARVAPGDVLVTPVAGPALAQILPRVAGVVAELGGSTSHLASIARERGVPMVLGVPRATERIPEGALVAVDGVAGIVRWMR